MKTFGRALFVAAFWPVIALYRRSISSALRSGGKFIKSDKH